VLRAIDTHTTTGRVSGNVSHGRLDDVEDVVQDRRGTRSARIVPGNGDGISIVSNASLQPSASVDEALPYAVLQVSGIDAIGWYPASTRRLPCFALASATRTDACS
jgi:hypothetical protein